MPLAAPVMSTRAPRTVLVIRPSSRTPVLAQAERCGTRPPGTDHTRWVSIAGCSSIPGKTAESPYYAMGRARLTAFSAMYSVEDPSTTLSRGDAMTAASVSFHGVGRTFGTRPGAAGAARRRPRGRRRRDRRDPRPERLRQVDAAAHRGRPGHARRRASSRSTARPWSRHRPALARSRSRSRGCCRGARSPRNVALGLPRGHAARRRPRARRASCSSSSGLTDFAGHRPREVSGGMAQRTSLARALARNPGGAAARRAVRRARRPDPAADAGPAARRARRRAHHGAARHPRRRRGAPARRPRRPARHRRRAGPARRIRADRRRARAPARATAARPSSPSCARRCSTASASTATAPPAACRPRRPSRTTRTDGAPQHPPVPHPEGVTDDPAPPFLRSALVARAAAAACCSRAASPARARPPSPSPPQSGDGRRARGRHAQHRLRDLQPAEPGHQGPGLARGGPATTSRSTGSSRPARTRPTRRCAPARSTSARPPARPRCSPARTARRSRSSTSTPSPSGRRSSCPTGSAITVVADLQGQEGRRHQGHRPVLLPAAVARGGRASPLDEVDGAEPAARRRLGRPAERLGRRVGRARPDHGRRRGRPARRCSTATSTSTATASSTRPSRSSPRSPTSRRPSSTRTRQARAWAQREPRGDRRDPRRGRRRSTPPSRRRSSTSAPTSTSTPCPATRRSRCSRRSARSSSSPATSPSQDAGRRGARRADQRRRSPRTPTRPDPGRAPCDPHGERPGMPLEPDVRGAPASCRVRRRRRSPARGRRPVTGTVGPIAGRDAGRTARPPRPTTALAARRRPPLVPRGRRRAPARSLLLALWQWVDRRGLVPLVPAAEPRDRSWHAAVDLARARPARASTSRSRPSACSSASPSAPRSASPLGAVVGLSRLGDVLLAPTLGAIRAVPSLAWVPLLILWIKIGEDSKITLIAIGAFFPVYTTVAAALRHVDRQLRRGRPRVRAARRAAVHDGAAAGRRCRRSSPALRLALAQSWLFLVAAELIASSMGLGFLLVDSGNNGRVDRIFLAIILLAVLGKLTDALIGAGRASYAAEEMGMTLRTIVHPARSERTARDHDPPHGRTPADPPRGDRNADAAFVAAAEADPVAFWDGGRAPARLGRAVAHRRTTWAAAGRRRPRRADRPGGAVVRGGRLNVAVNCVDRHVDGGPRRQGRAALRGRAAATAARSPTPSCSARSSPRRERAHRPRHRPGRPRRRLPAGARSRPSSSRSRSRGIGAIHSLVFGGFSAEALRFRVAGHGREAARHQRRAVPPRAGRRGEGRRRRGRRRRSTTSSTCSWCAAPATRPRRAVDRRAATSGGTTPSTPHPTCTRPRRSTPRRRCSSSTPRAPPGSPKGLVHTSAAGTSRMRPGAHWARVRRQARRRALVHRRPRLGDRAHLRDLRAAVQRRSRRSSTRARPNTPHRGRHFEIIERYGVTDVLHGADAHPHVHDAGSPTACPPSTTCRASACSASVGEAINPEAWVWFRDARSAPAARPIVDTWWQSETGAAVMAPLPGRHDAQARLRHARAARALDAASSTTPATRSPAARAATSSSTGTWPGMARTVWGDPRALPRLVLGAVRASSGYFFSGDGAKVRRRRRHLAARPRRRRHQRLRPPALDHRDRVGARRAPGRRRGRRRRRARWRDRAGASPRSSCPPATGPSTDDRTPG